MNLNFPKSEKLKSSKAIKRLFEEGKTITKFPIKVIYLPQEGDRKTQAAFAVPKRNFKKAVTRNRIKRQMREAYRLNKALLSTNNCKNFALLLLYLGKEEPQYNRLESAITSLLKQLRDENN